MSRKTWLYPLLLIALGTVAYVSSFHGVFLFDDHRAITNNPHMSDPASVLFKARFIGEYTFKLNYALGGVGPLGYHLVNIIIHLCAGLVLYGIVRRTLMSPRLARRYGGEASGIALACASIWLVHPLETASVTYIAQRFESLMGLLFLLALYCFIRAGGSRKSSAWYALTAVVFVVGMGVKEVMFTLPFVILLYDAVFLHDAEHTPMRSRWRVHVALFSLCVVGVVLYVLNARTPGYHARGTVMDMSPWIYLLTETQVLLHYLRLAVWPDKLCLDYAWIPVAHLGQVWWQACFVLLLFIATVIALLKRHPAGFLGAWCFIILAPSSSFIPIADAAFEQRVYLPLAALILGALLIMDRLANWVALKAMITCRVVRVVKVFAVVVISFLFVGMTINRNGDYWSESGMWQDVVSKQKHNFRAWLALTNALLDEGNGAEAVLRARELVSIIEEVLESSDSEMARNNARYWYPRAFNQLGRALLTEGNIATARNSFEKAISLSCDYVEARYNLSIALMLEGRLDDAIIQLKTVLKQKPDYAGALMMMGHVLVRKGQFREAQGMFLSAYSLAPESVRVKIGLAWFRATCPDDEMRNGAEALCLASAVCEATDWRSARALDTLAAAYAEMGRFDDAIAVAQRAVEVATAAEGVDASISDEGEGEHSVAEIRKRMEVYRSGKAFRKRSE